jgi:hypothetical protein
MLELARQCDILLFFYWNCSDSVVFCCFLKNNKIPHCQDSSNRKTRKYHTVRTVPTFMKNNKIPHCQDSSNRKITKYHNVSIGTVLTVWYYVIFLLELSWQCGILLFFLDVGSSNRKITKYHNVRTVPTSMKNNKIPQSGQFQNPIEKQQNTTLSSVVFWCFSRMLELFWQCCILLFFY